MRAEREVTSKRYTKSGGGVHESTNVMRTMHERWNVAAEAGQDMRLQRSQGGVDGSGIERVDSLIQLRFDAGALVELASVKPNIASAAKQSSRDFNSIYSWEKSPKKASKTIA